MLNVLKNAPFKHDTKKGNIHIRTFEWAIGCYYRACHSELVEAFAAWLSLRQARTDICVLKWILI